MAKQPKKTDKPKLKIVGGKDKEKKTPKKKTKEPTKKGKRKGPESVLSDKETSLSIIPHTGKEDYHELRHAVQEQRSVIDNARWLLAEALSRVNDNQIYHHWGYPSWELYVKTEVEMTSRTAHYLISMYEWFTVNIIDHVKDLDPEDPKRVDAVARRDEIIKSIKEMGWTKGKCLVGVLDLSNADEWIARANSMSATELEGVAKKALQELHGMPSTGIETMKNVSFRLAEDQLSVVENAIQHGGGVLESEKRGHILSMICQEYLSTSMAQKEEGQSKKSRHFEKLGAIFGVRFIAMDKETGKIVHGETLFKELVKEEKESAV